MTFPPKITSVSFDISIHNDKILERKKGTFYLTVVDSSLHNQGFIFTTGTYSKTTVVIVDSIGKWYVHTYIYVKPCVCRPKTLRYVCTYPGNRNPSVSQVCMSVYFCVCIHPYTHTRARTNTHT